MKQVPVDEVGLSKLEDEVRRKDGELILTGRGGYLDDVDLPGLLHVAVLRSPLAHARIIKVDASQARERRGVRAVLTGEEALTMARPIPHFFEPSLVGGKTAEFRCLAVDKVRYVGEPVAAVAAESLNDAEAALDSITVEYEQLPVVVDADDALADDAPLVFEEWGDNVLARFTFAEGDAATVLAEAPHVIEDEIRIQRYQTAPMETRGYIAHWEWNGRLTFYGSTQNPHPLRTELATVLNLPESQIRVIAPRVGGGFGHKFNGYQEEPLVCLLSKTAGAPVKWLETRAESLLVGAREFVHRFAVAFDNDGRILAIRNRIIGNIGALATWGGWSMTYPAGMSFPGPYKVNHYDIESLAVVTNKAPWNGARGYGKEAAALALERMVDLVAQRLSLDPADVRRRNFIPSDQFPYWTVAKHLDSGNYVGALDKVLSLSRYEDRRREQELARHSGRLMGVGVAFELTPEGGDFAGSFVRGYDTSTVRVSPSGAVTVLTGVTSPGTGNETSIAKVVAEEFGLPIDRIYVVEGDTDLCPYGFGNFSSRSLTTGGGAAFLAARDVKARIAAAAGVLLKANPGDLLFSDGYISVKGAQERRLSSEAVAEQLFRRAFAIPGITEAQLESTLTDGPTNFYFVPDAQGRMAAYPTFPYSAHVAVVEIDRETGVVSVIDYAAVGDCGTIISHTFVDSQLFGGIAMGIGGALWEELPYDLEGRPEARAFKEYLLPRAPDLPTFHVAHQVTPSPYTTLGTKGAGESGVGGAVASIANAVNDALSPLGVTVNDMPLSPPRLLRTILSGGKK